MSLVPRSDWYAPVGSPRGRITLLHGLTGAPDEMALLAERLVDEGYLVRVPCLAGHLRSIEVLAATTIAEWEQDLEALFLVPWQGPGPEIVGGCSFGAVLTLRALQRYPGRFSAAMLYGPTVLLRSYGTQRLLEFLAKWIPESLLPIFGTRQKRRPSVPAFVRQRVAYGEHSVAALARLFKLRGQALSELPKILCPVLIAQDPADHYLLPDGADFITERLGSEKVDQLWFPGGEHELLIGPHSEQVVSATLTFLAEYRNDAT